MDPTKATAGASFKGMRVPKVCKIMAFMAIIMGSGPLFYILLAF